MRVWIAVGLFSAGCVESFNGSNIQIDLTYAIPVQASAYGTAQPGQLDPRSHYTLYAIQQFDGGQRLFELQRFEIHPIVDLDSPCYIDIGEHVPFPGLHVSQYVEQVKIQTGIADIANPPPAATEEQKITLATAMQRQSNIEALAGDSGIHVVSSASEGAYPPVAADCNGSIDQIPPPSCTMPDANARRAKLCQAAWAADKSLFEGTDRILTSPLGGITAGMVDGINPVNQAPVGGAQFFVDEALKSMDAYALYTQMDGVDGPGTLVMYGEPTDAIRGVLNVHLTSPSSTLTAEMVIFPNLADDEVSF